MGFQLLRTLCLSEYSSTVSGFRHTFYVRSVEGPICKVSCIDTCVDMISVRNVTVFPDRGYFEVWLNFTV
jgi:hypothetical protein